MYAPASFKAARRETPAGRLFSGVDFSGEIPYHRSILSSAVRCGKWSEQDSREELLIPSAEETVRIPGPSGREQGVAELVQWEDGGIRLRRGPDRPLRQRAGADRGRRPPPVWAGPLRAFRDSRLSGCAARRKAAPKAVFIKS